MLCSLYGLNTGNGRLKVSGTADRGGYNMYTYVLAIL